MSIAINHNSEIHESQGLIFFPSFGLVFLYSSLKKCSHLFVFHTFPHTNRQVLFYVCVHVVIFQPPFLFPRHKTQAFPLLAHTPCFSPKALQSPWTTEFVFFPFGWITHMLTEVSGLWECDNGWQVGKSELDFFKHIVLILSPLV